LKNIKYLLVLILVLPNLLFSFDSLSLNFNKENSNIPNKKYYFTIPATAFKSKKEYLPVFDVSCNNIKYTGAYEQVFIDYLEDLKTYVKELVKPYTTFSKMDAGILTYAFGKCLTKNVTDEIIGSKTSSSIIHKTIEATGKSNSSLIIGVGAKGSYQGSFALKTETVGNFDTYGVASKITKIADKEGMWNNTVRCMMKEREDIYLKLYNILTYALKIKWVTATAINKQCSLDLRKKNEVVPTWAEITGINTQKYVDALSKQFDMNKNNSKFGKFMSDYFNEVFQYDVKNNTSLCVNWDAVNGVCKDRIPIDTNGCQVDSDGYLSGNCSCIQGVDIYTGKKCSLPSDFKFDNEYGINVNKELNAVQGIPLSNIEKIFINNLEKSPYYNSYVPYDLFFDNELILFRWNLFIDNKIMMTLDLLPKDNFDLKTNVLNNVDLGSINMDDVLLKDNKGKYIYSTTDFTNNLILRLAYLQCGDINGICAENIKKYKYVDDLDSIVKTFLKYQKLYKSKIDFVDNIYSFHINQTNYKLKLKQQYDSIKQMFKVNKLYRIVLLKDNFFNNWILTTKKKMIEYRLAGKSDKDIRILDNFSKKMILDMKEDTNIDYDVFSKQLYDMEKQNYKERKMNMMFMKTNSEMELLKAKIIRNLYN